jgi:hypothetical protein
MKHITLILLIFFSFLIGNSQTVQWVKKGTSPGFENGNGITCDDSGNVYCGGQIEYTSVFDNVILDSHGSHDIMLVKYNKDGVIQWGRSAGSHGGDVCNALGIDASHNSYVAGEVEQDCDFGGGVILSSAGGNDIFLAKYSPGGKLMWAKRWGDTGQDKALACVTTPSGDSYISGYYTASISIGSTTLNASGGRDLFLAKINTNGIVQWAKSAGGAADDRGLGLALDKNGNVLLAGSFTGSANFGSTHISNSGNNSAFIAKYNSNGTVQWVKAAGTCCDTTVYTSVSVDENNDVYVAGYFNISTTIETNHLTSSGNADAIIAKYNSNGNLQWVRNGGGIDQDIAYGIVADTNNHYVYVTGNVSAAGSFSQYNYTISGFRDIFLLAYDPSGNLIWGKINGGSHRDIGSAITCDNKGYIYTTGLFNGDAFFDSYLITGYPNQPWADFYVDKISSLPSTPPTVSSSNLIVTNGVCTDLDLSFTPGNGSGRLVIAHRGSFVNVLPVNGEDYSGSAIFGNGQDLGNGNFIVYNGNGNQVDISGLDPAMDYYFSVIEYSGSGASLNYTSSPLTGIGTTSNLTISISGILNPVCTGNILNLQASGASTYTWSPSADLSSSTGSLVVATPQSTTTFTVNAQDASGCQAVNVFTIIVNPLPVLHFPDLNDVCNNDSPVTLNTGTPAGGTYTGPGVTNDLFNPSLLTPGNYIIQYFYSDSNGCLSSNDASITVKAIPSLNLGTDTTICVYHNITLRPGNGYASYLWSDGSTSHNFNVDSSGIGLGTKIISLQVSNSAGCFNSDTIKIAFDLCAGISELENEKMNAYPNPFIHNIHLSANNNFTYFIFDIYGKLVDEGAVVNGNENAGENLSPGVYLLEMENKAVHHYFTVVKM